MSPICQHPVEMLILNAAFDAGGRIPMDALRDAIPANGHDLRKAIDAQHNIGNVRRDGCALELTASARAAIAAGRAASPMSINRTPGGKPAGKRMMRTMAAVAAHVTAPLEGCPW